MLWFRFATHPITQLLLRQDPGDAVPESGPIPFTSSVRDSRRDPAMLPR